MAKIVYGGPVPANDPMFSSGYLLFNFRKSRRSKSQPHISSDGPSNKSVEIISEPVPPSLPENDTPST